MFEGVWHTAIVVGGLEYYFGCGVSQSSPGLTPFGRPVQVIELGSTRILRDSRNEYLQSLHMTYTATAYSLFHRNCNNFSNDFSIFLTGSGIPAHIMRMPQELMATPLGQMLASKLSPLEHQLGNIHQQPAGEIRAFASPSAEPTAPFPTAQIFTRQSAAPAAAIVATAAPAMPACSSLQALQDKNPAADCSGIAAANEAPAVLAAAESIADATGLAWASAVASQPDRGGLTGALSQAVRSNHVSNTDLVSLQKESLALPPEAENSMASENHASFAAVPSFAASSWSGAHALAVDEPQKRKDQTPPVGASLESMPKQNFQLERQRALEIMLNSSATKSQHMQLLEA
ncbi:TPA: hypothetical protein ACH3X1_008410 [Trebouxia sp. C0004]